MLSQEAIHTEKVKNNVNSATCLALIYVEVFRMKYVIDRFEDHFAVCEDEEGKMINIERVKLPEDVKEGDIIFEDQEGFKIDSEETESQKERIEKLADELWEE